MSPKAPVLSGNEVIQILQKAGYVYNRQKGSHIILWNAEQQRAVVVPEHGQRDLPPGTFRSILRQAGLTVAEFVELMDK